MSIIHTYKRRNNQIVPDNHNYQEVNYPIVSIFIVFDKYVIITSNFPSSYVFTIRATISLNFLLLQCASGIDTISSSVFFSPL